MKKLIEKIKNIKMPFVSRKKYETALENNKILNKNRLELSNKNIELQQKLREMDGKRLDAATDLKCLRVKLNKQEELLNAAIIKKNEIEKEYKKLIRKTKKEVISKHCPTCEEKLKEEKKNGRK